MMNTSIRSLVVGVCLLIAWGGDAQPGAGQNLDGVSAELEAATKRATAESHRLEYRFSPGEQICWTVKHLSTTEATIQGKTQTTRARTISTKMWDVEQVDQEGNITFVHRVADIDMWQKISDRPELRYNSQSDRTPPPEFMHVAQSVNTPLATVKISPSGKILHREGTPPQTNLGLGDICMPLPAEPVKIGQQWQTSQDIQVRRPDAMKQRIKIRIVYTLKSVKTGVATIGAKTEVVTPIHDPRIQAQLVQQMTNGEIRFDMDSGRILAREIGWDETVVGFNGADSLMKYLARFTEELQNTSATAQQPSAPRR